MATIEQLLQTKPKNIWSVAPDCLMYDAIKLMNDKNIGALVVLETGKLVGIVSERDYLRKVILKDKPLKKTPVSEIMTRAVICVSLDATIQECMALISDKRIRHLPVVVNDKVVGIISIGDVLKNLLSEKENIIEQLTEYMTEGY